jgi:hypothetical protein
MNSEVCDIVDYHLKKFQYPEEILKSSGVRSNRTPSYLQVLEILHSALNYSSELVEEKLLIYPKHRLLFTNSNPETDLQFLRLERASTSTQMSYIPLFVRQDQVILIYQSLGATTGGTLALKLFHQRLILLGFESVLCTSKNDDQRCISPTGKEIVITGEWCHGVLESHGENSSNYRGRGIQYHLGFHHYDDLCRSGHHIHKLVHIFTEDM